MFNRYFSRIVRILPAVIASLAIMGCSDDIGMKPDYTRSGEDVEIKVSVSLPKMEVQTRADLDESSLNQVNSLWIRTYSADTGKATSDWMEITDPLPTTDTEVARPVSIKTQSGRSFIVAVANVENYGVSRSSLTPTPLRELLTEANTWQEFLDIAAVTPSTQQYVRAPLPPLTMSGCFSDLIVGTEPANIADWQTKNFQSFFIPAQKGTVDLTTKGAIHMRRLVSHVNFNFIPADDLTVTVNSYQVMNAPRYSWVYERPALNGMLTNYGDLAESEDAVGTYFADIPQYNSQFVTENPDGSSSFDFWQGESKHAGRAETYGDRGKISETKHFTSLTGDVWTPNNEASYVLVNCTVEYKNQLNVNQEGEINGLGGTQAVNRTGEVTYLIHLGAVGGVLTDFNCYRNANYTYNITVNGVNDIRFDAYATDETFHNEEGMVVDITQATIDIDAHYAAFNIELTQAELQDPNFGFLIIAYEDGNQYTITDANDRNNDGSIIYDDKGNVIPEKYYNWIELRPTSDENTLAEYKPRYGGNSDGSTFLLSSLNNGWNSMGVDERSESGWYTVFVNEYTYEPMYTGTNGYADETWNGAGEPSWMGYVNQNPRRFYIRVQQKTSPDGNSVYARSKYGVSQQSMMTYYSDQNFAPTSGDIPAGTAIGVERENETLGMNLRHTFAGGTSTANGRWNIAQYLNGSATDITNLSINSANVDLRPAWNNYIDAALPLEVGGVSSDRAQGGPAIPERTISNGNPHKIPKVVNLNLTDGASFTFNDPQANNEYMIESINACMSRNRDNNGNGRIEPDELRWFVPAMDQYLAIMLGEASLPERLMPYERISQLPYVNSNNRDWGNAQNGRIQNDYYSRYMAVSSNSGLSVMWLMEGTSTSIYDKMHEWSENQSFPWTIRCIRNLGSDLTTVTNDDRVSKPYVHDSENRRIMMSYYNLSSIRANRYTSNGSEGGAAMPIHTITSPYNSLYQGFEYASDNLEIPTADRPSTVDDTEFSNTYGRLGNYINSNPCGNANYNGTGWRIPNQQELTIMRNLGVLTAVGANTTWLSCTVNYFNYSTGVGSVTDTSNRLYLIVTPSQGTQLTRDNMGSANGSDSSGRTNGFYVRCIRDVNN